MPIRLVAVLAVFAAGIGSAAASGGMFSKEQADRGERLYKANCASCHGNELEGGEHAPPLQGGEFWEEWDGKAVRGLYSRILTSMPPDSPGILSEKTIIDIVAKIVRANGVPEGAKTIERADELNSLTLRQPE